MVTVMVFPQLDYVVQEAWLSSRVLENEASSGNGPVTKEVEETVFRCVLSSLSPAWTTWRQWIEAVFSPCVQQTFSLTPSITHEGPCVSTRSPKIEGRQSDQNEEGSASCCLCYS